MEWRYTYANSPTLEPLSTEEGKSVLAREQYFDVTSDLWGKAHRCTSVEGTPRIGMSLLDLDCFINENWLSLLASYPGPLRVPSESLCCEVGESPAAPRPRGVVAMCVHKDMLLEGGHVVEIPHSGRFRFEGCKLSEMSWNVEYRYPLDWGRHPGWIWLVGLRAPASLAETSDPNSDGRAYAACNHSAGCMIQMGYVWSGSRWTVAFPHFLDSDK